MVPFESAAAEMDISGGAFLGTRRGDLIVDFFRIPRGVGIRDSIGVIARPHMAVFMVLLDPPFEKADIRLLFPSHFPIKLWRIIIDPAFVEPKLRVGVKGFVLIHSCNSFRMTGAPDSERTDSDFYQWTLLLDLAVKTFNEIIYVLSSPIASGEIATGFLIFFPRAIVGKIGTASIRSIRIKVVIDVNAIDIVTFGDVENHIEGHPFCLLFCRIGPEKIAVLADNFGMRLADMIFGNLAFGASVARAIWIEPSVEFEYAFVGFFDNKCERIVIRFGCLAHFAGQIL